MTGDQEVEVERGSLVAARVPRVAADEEKLQTGSLCGVHADLKGVALVSTWLKCGE